MAHRQALVTGGAGFIGRHLCQRLASEGYRVRALDNLSEGRAENLAELSSVDLLVGDIRDRKTVDEASTGANVVFHLAARKSVPRSMVEPELTTAVNVDGTLNVLLAARQVDARVVLASSSSVYGEQERFPVPESATLRPQSPYAASKVAGEMYAQALWRSDKLRTVCLRYFNVYGPGQLPGGAYAAVVPAFIVSCLSGVAPVVFGDGKQRRTFSFVEDVADATFRCDSADQAAFGDAFNIAGSDGPIEILTLLSVVASVCGVEVNAHFAAARAGDIARSEPDISRASDVLGFSSATQISDGLKKTVSWFQEQ